MSFSSFTPQEGDASFETRYEDEAIWSVQRLMTELFDIDVRVISKHLGPSTVPPSWGNHPEIPDSSFRGLTSSDS